MPTRRPDAGAHQLSPARATIARVRITQALRAGVASMTAGAVTGGSSSAPPALSLEGAALASPSSDALPPLELGSPWVTSELDTIVWSELLTDTTSLPMTRAAAMSVPSVSKSRHVICPTMARVPLLLEGGSNPETLEFIRQPDPAVSRWLMLTWTYDDMLFHGVSWWVVLERYATSRRPRVARRVVPGGVTRRDGGGWAVYDKPVDPANLLRIDGPHEGLLSFGAITLRQAAALERSAARVADNPIPAIDLHQTSGMTLPPEERRELVAEWRKARAATGGGVAYTSPQIDARAMGAPAEQLLIRGRNAAAVDVARHAGVPADSIDASVEHASMTYSTVETKMRALIDFGLSAYGMALTSRLSLDDVSPAGTTVVHDYSSITAIADDDPSTPAPSSGQSAPATVPAPREDNPA